jgi:hypothetical protein
MTRGEIHAAHELNTGTSRSQDIDGRFSHPLGADKNDRIVFGLAGQNTRELVHVVLEFRVD